MTHAITVHKLSKRYQIYHEQRSSYSTLRETLARKAKQFLRAALRRHPSDSSSFEDFWALDDVSFAIEPGSRVGIVGRNGAGKSTLLKILSRITAPTHGTVTIKGRVSSLLEVGTGFHPELTGKENIFLNGAILGMSKAEIQAKFDQIVAFAELEKFLDTPIKRFSSGMVTRLAFSVAAHLDPDVLIVDEVLSVGDYNFRDKCINKMGEISKEGRTVLFVSHNMNTVLTLCDRALLLDKGRLVAFDTVDSVVANYLHQQANTQASWTGASGDACCSFTQATLRNAASNTQCDFFYRGATVRVCFDYKTTSAAKDLVLTVQVTTLRGLCLAQASLRPQHKLHAAAFSPGVHHSSIDFDSSLFYEGEYLVKIEARHIHGRIISADEVILRFSLYDSEGTPVVDNDVSSVVLSSQWNVDIQESLLCH